MIYAEERYKKILDLLTKQEYVSTTELINILNTSRETVRRDVNTLAKKGLIIKVHGGISSKENINTLYDTPVILRESTNVQLKKKLCEYTAKYIQNDDIIFIDNSSTTAHLIHYIPKNYHLTLITNSIKLLIELTKIKVNNWNIICLGGVFDFNTLSTTNYLTTNNLSIFKPTKSFISCHGIDSDYSITDSYLNDIEIKRTVIKNSKENFLLIDSSKLNRKGVMVLTEIINFQHIITNFSKDISFIDNLKKITPYLEIVNN